MGIAAGAGIMGLYMIVCGFFQPLNSMPKVRGPACGRHQLPGRRSVAQPAALTLPPANPCSMQPIFRYPLSYIAYHTWAFTGLMENEFKGTGGWGCPPTGDEVLDAACPPRDGAAVLNYYDIMGVNKVDGAGYDACLARRCGRSSNGGGGCAAFQPASQPATNPHPCPLLPPLQWICLVILGGMALAYRTLFFITLKIKERKSK